LLPLRHPGQRQHRPHHSPHGEQGDADGSTLAAAIAIWATVAAIIFQ